MEPVDVFADVFEAGFHHAGLHEDGREEDEGGLDHEGTGECPTARRGATEPAAQAGKEDGPDEEGHEGDE